MLQQHLSCQGKEVAESHLRYLFFNVCSTYLSSARNPGFTYPAKVCPLCRSYQSTSSSVTGYRQCLGQSLPNQYPLSLQPLLNSRTLAISPSRSFSPTVKVANKIIGFQLQKVFPLLSFISSLASLLTTLLTSPACLLASSPLSNNSQIPLIIMHKIAIGLKTNPSSHGQIQ